MGLAYKTSVWSDRLWTEHLELSESGRALVKQGVDKQGDAFAGFPADLHARLYLPSDPESTDSAPEWATQLHGLATETAEWNQLKLMTARNGFAAGIAAEILLEHLLPHVPDAPPASISDSHDNENNRPRDGEGSRNPGAGPSPEQAGGNSDAQVRAALRRAAREARDAVQDAEADLEGLTTPLGMSAPGYAVNPNTDPANMKAIREAHAQLRNSPRLRQIANLAGRLERLASSKARSKVKPGVGEIHGVEIGDDIARLLPIELVCLRHPKRKLVLMKKLAERQALTYGMTGREPTARGPIVVLLDESSSMREDGKDIWSKAVALALLSTATKQRRSWHIVAFSGSIHREVEVPVGSASIKTVAEALDCRCHGGTDFDAPILRAIEIIKTSRSMKNADVVVITDGEDSLEDATVEAATALTKTEGVSWFVVAVGSYGGETCAASLGPIATSMVHVVRTDDGDEAVVPVINLERR